MMTIIHISFLLLILLDFYIFIFALKQTGRHKIYRIVLGLMMISVIILYSLSIDTSSIVNNQPILAIINIFHRIPSPIHVLIILIILTLSIILLYEEKQYEQSTLTRTSIKESIDNLPMGLSFSRERGIVFLSNRHMNTLCHKITGRELQDAEYFWQKIKEKNQNTQKSLETNNPTSIIQIDDGQTWSFSRHPITINKKEGVQITAINITELDQLRSQLKKKNAEFLKMNIRLHEYSQDLASIKAKEERLATKNQLHNELGYILLATRKVLTDRKYDEEGESILNLWKQNITVLLSGSGLKEKNVFEELLQSASDIGISLQLEGDIPKENRIKDLVLIAAVEALNNAIRHAEASELKLLIEETEGEYRLEFINDGILPEGEITEGGGLSTLRGKIEDKGGRMGIDIGPVFKLWLIVPKGREVYSYEKSVDS